MKRLLVLISILVAQAIPTTAQSKEKDLDRWVERDLAPFVQQQLIMHPRFKGETVMFVVLKDNAPAPISNALALSLRDRLLDAAVDTRGVSIGWQQGRQSATELQAADCTRDNVHYYIGVEITQNLDSSYSVGVRALDLEDRNWVTGFGRSWRGKLSAIQRQAMRQVRVDETFLGAREVPFSLAQTDLLAAHLAHELGCRLLQGREEDYVVSTTARPAGENELQGAVQLISNNLTSREALQLTSDPENANADLQGKAHLIDGQLYQYWVTITPRDPDSELTALSSSAYIELPWHNDQPVAQAAVTEAPTPANSAPALPARISIPNAGAKAVLAPLRISERDSDRYALLQSTARSDAIVFFLVHQANDGLVRLGNSDCRQRTRARVARSNEPLAFRIPAAPHGSVKTTETYDWFVEPEVDTYYALAVTNSKVARRIANHVDALPLRCTQSTRRGLEGQPLRDWLEEFAMIAADSAGHIDWRGVRVRNVL
ncbi:MAG: hypothetical protein QNJ07_00385 [Woeseiaceae bacterium]|nr:hypothetical protein [Woeseiaceae bacterium]